MESSGFWPYLWFKILLESLSYPTIQYYTPSGTSGAARLPIFDAYDLVNGKFSNCLYVSLDLPESSLKHARNTEICYTRNYVYDGHLIVRDIPQPRALLSFLQTATYMRCYFLDSPFGNYAPTVKSLVNVLEARI